MEVVEIFEQFRIVSSREIVEYDQSDETEKKIDDNLLNFYVHLGILIGLFILTMFFFDCREDGFNDHF